MYQSVKEKTKALASRVAAPVVLLTALGVGSANATVAEDITAAFSSGSVNLGLAASGVIAMVAVVTGIGFVVSMLRK
ncbi:hypothetical protein [Methylomonas methanica]|uniref:Phage coat protein n=1 Tax=Methylomonas methanica (strain DSM 25384 / MC09) TaxID=857087 RepID=F9ZVC6_METMM|nr:hypothetical protein [Methylomonas methanica]AEG00736.1 hypothetical protein Metme_2334 [Methylomonas methanica MC09]